MQPRGVKCNPTNVCLINRIAPGSARNLRNEGTRLPDVCLINRNAPGSALRNEGTRLPEYCLSALWPPLGDGITAHTRWRDPLWVLAPFPRAAPSGLVCALP